MDYNSTSGLYEVIIPGQAGGTCVSYKIIAYDKSGNFAVQDDDRPYFVYQVIPEFSSFIIMPLFMIATLLAVMVCRRKTVSDRTG